MSRTTDDVIRDFFYGRGRKPKHSGNVSHDGETLYSYSMPVAWWGENGTCFLRNHDDSPSVTTSKHISKTLHQGRGHIYLPPDPVLCHLKMSHRTIVDFVAHYSARFFTFKRDWKPYIVGEIVLHRLEVPHYHQLPMYGVTNATTAWMKFDTVPPKDFPLYNLMVKKDHQAAFHEGRLAQYGTWLIETRPDVKDKPKKVGTRTITIPSPWWDNRSTFIEEHATQPGLYRGTLFGRHIAKGLWYKIHRPIPTLPGPRQGRNHGDQPLDIEAAEAVQPGNLW